MQLRAITGKLFENSLIKDGWIVKSKSPKLSWSGNGQNNFIKMKSINYQVNCFLLNENNDLSKYDIYHPKTNEFREVKKYTINKVKNWTLYSEPYFKVATKSQQKQIDVKTYNKFVEEFYDYNIKTGLIDTIQNGITSFSKGITLQDGFIPNERIEFRTVVVDGWSGYKRITIQFKVNE